MIVCEFDNIFRINLTHSLFLTNIQELWPVVFEYS